MTRSRAALRLALLLAVVALPLLAACGDEDAGDDPGSVTLDPEPTPSSTDPVPPEPPTETTGTAPQDVVDQSIALLTEQLGVTTDDITVVRAVEVTWRDGAIGCPKPGMGYTQALVPGSLVELEVDGQTYAFHQAQGKAPFYCASPTEPLEES